MKQFLLFFPAVLILLLFSCGDDRASDEDGPALSHLAVDRTIQIRQGAGRLFLADVAGGPEKEIVLVYSDEIRILSPAGAELKQIPIPFEKSRPAFLSDVNRDRKADIVFGFTGEATVRVAAMDGNGEVLFDTFGSPLETGDTVPQFLAHDRIYFIANTFLRVSPRIVGYIDMNSDSVVTLSSSIPVPLGLSFSSEKEEICVSLGAADRDLLPTPDPDPIPANQNALLVLDTELEPVMYEPIGVPVTDSGSIHSDRPAAVESRIVDLVGDGTAEYAVVVQHPSTLFGGPSEVRLYDLDGSLLADHIGPEESFGALLPVPCGDSQCLAVMWEQAGTVEFLDSSFHVTARGDLPGSVHELRPVYAGQNEIVVVDLDRWAVMNRAGDVVFSTRERGQIRDIVVASTGDETMMYVLSDELVRYTVSDEQDSGTVSLYTRPAGLPITIRDAEAGEVVHDGTDVLPGILRLTAGRYVAGETEFSVVAGQWSEIVVDLSPGDGDSTDADTDADTGPQVENSGFHPVASASLPDAPGIAVVGDFAGDSDPEIFYSWNGYSEWRVFSRDLTTVRDATLPWVPGLAYFPGDLNGDGKDDIAFEERGDPVRVGAVTAEGRPIFRSVYLYGYRTTAVNPTLHAGNLVWHATSGWTGYPRGIFAVNPEDGSIEYSYDTAGFVRESVSDGDTLYLHNYTPGNGFSVLRHDGTVDRDDTMFVHILDDRGAPDGRSGPFPSDHSRGMIIPFLFESEPHYLIRRDETYNPGPTGIFKLHDDGSFTQVDDGPPNSPGNVQLRTMGSEEYAVVLWNATNEMRIYGPGFQLVDRSTTVPSVLFDIGDLNNDGTWDVVRLEEGVLVSCDLDGGNRRTYELSSGPAGGFKIVTIPDRKSEVVLYSDTEMVILTFE